MFIDDPFEAAHVDEVKGLGIIRKQLTGNFPDFENQIQRLGPIHAGIHDLENRGIDNPLKNGNAIALITDETIP